MGQWVAIRQEDQNVFSGYLAVPPKGYGPGLLLLQEIWGVNPHIRSLADQYAADGYVVLAPDVFWRQQNRVALEYSQVGTEQAYRHYGALDFAQTAQDLAAAIEHLSAYPIVQGGIGAMGFCLGGRLAFLLGGNPRLSAVVSYYGSGLGNHLDIIPNLKCPLLFHFAGEDHLIPLSEVDALMPKIQASVEASHHIYDGQKHGFNCPERASYSQRSAALAKARTLEFLSRHL